MAATPKPIRNKRTKLVNKLNRIVELPEIKKNLYPQEIKNEKKSSVKTAKLIHKSPKHHSMKHSKEDLAGAYKHMREYGG